MKKFNTENKSIIISIIYTMIFYIIVFCIPKINLLTKNTKPEKLINNNYIEIQIYKNNTNNIDTSKSENKNLKTEILQKNEDAIIQETKIKEEKITTKETNLIEKENTSNDKSENQSESFYPVEVAKKITDDVIDKKIIENIYYPEKATRRGIEGKIIIKVEISKNGNLLNYEIISKNNNQILEDASISTINKIFPIKELEIKNTVENFSTIITFVYKLN
jgi:TonB family protein